MHGCFNRIPLVFYLLNFIRGGREFTIKHLSQFISAI